MDDRLARFDLRNVVAVVTGGAGGASGLGLTTTEALLRAGSRVCVWDVDRQAIERAKAELAANGLEAHWEQVDVADIAQLERAYRSTINELGPVDLLVNNAALKMDYMLPRKERLSRPLALWELNPARFRRLVEVNVLGPLFTCRLIARDMAARRQGSIINVSTSLRTQRSPSHIPYGPSKAMLEKFTLALAKQLRPHGVRANVVLPGGSVNRRGESDPSRRPFDILVPVVLWLASDDSAGVTGRVFVGDEFELPADR